MVAGLPLDAWILIAASVGLGLGIELLYLRAQRAESVEREAGGRAAGEESSS